MPGCTAWCASSCAPPEGSPPVQRGFAPTTRERRALVEAAFGMASPALFRPTSWACPGRRPSRIRPMRRAAHFGHGSGSPPRRSASRDGGARPFRRDGAGLLDLDERRPGHPAEPRLGTGVPDLCSRCAPWQCGQAQQGRRSGLPMRVATIPRRGSGAAPPHRHLTAPGVASERRPQRLTPRPVHGGHGV